jgi:hypothetical protein
MYLTPSDFLDEYHHISVATQQGSFTIAVNKYRCSTPEFGGTVDAEEVKDGFLGITNKGIIDEAGGVGPFVRVFVGKGSPEEFATVLALVAKYKDAFVKAYKKGSDTRGQCAKMMDGYRPEQVREMLQAFTDKYLGLDCNGWVGNFVKRTKKSPFDADTEIPRYYYHCNSVRKTLAEVLTLDILVWANFQHTALIGSWDSALKKADVYQSTYGGPQHAVHELVAEGNGLFSLAPSSIVGGQFYVVNLELLTA